MRHIYHYICGAICLTRHCQRSCNLKKAILHRKNSLFYKTLNGTDVGDLYMTLIHTCEPNHVNPFDYLTALQRRTEELAASPAECMPWNYRPTPEQSLSNH